MWYTILSVIHDALQQTESLTMIKKVNARITEMKMSSDT